MEAKTKVNQVEDEYQDENVVYDRVCVVCGKSVKVEEASVYLKVEAEMISICCLPCYEVYQKKPNYFPAVRKILVAQRRVIQRGDTDTPA
jgi:hypothetical protein